MKQTIIHSVLGAAAAGGICFAAMSCLNLNILVKSILGMVVSLFVYLAAIIPEIKLLKRF